MNRVARPESVAHHEGSEGLTQIFQTFEDSTAEYLGLREAVHAKVGLGFISGSLSPKGFAESQLPEEQAEKLAHRLNDGWQEKHFNHLVSWAEHPDDKGRLTQTHLGPVVESERIQRAWELVRHNVLDAALMVCDVPMDWRHDPGQTASVLASVLEHKLEENPQLKEKIIDYFKMNVAVLEDTDVKRTLKAWEDAMSSSWKKDGIEAIKDWVQAIGTPKQRVFNDAYVRAIQMYRK